MQNDLADIVYCDPPLIFLGTMGESMVEVIRIIKVRRSIRNLLVKV